LLTDEVKQSLDFKGPGVVVCVGNSLRGDDGAGPFIASRLISNSNLHVIDAGTTPENYVGEIIAHDPSSILFIDAADFGGAPGEARIVPLESISEYALSTHSLPLGLVCALLAQSIQAGIRIIGIQVKDCAFGKEMSAEVKGTAEEMAAIINNR
jgi:hydrogenase 3 maturation protease